MTNHFSNSTDVAIIGGGPAGLACAIALRQRGIQCTVVEALSPVIDKSCGEGLMPDAIRSLALLGVSIDHSDGHPFRGILFANHRHRVTGDFPGETGIGVRRLHLHRRLSQRALDVGVDLRWSARPTLIDNEHMLVNGEPLQFQYLVGADGLSSSVRRWAGLDSSHVKSVRYGFRRHYKVAPWSDYVEVHWGRQGQIYITPVGEENVCVVAIMRNPQEDRWKLLDEFPEIERHLRDRPLLSQHRGAPSATCKLRCVERGSVALVGDASGSVDAITGEGLALSFRQAVAYADAVATGNLEQYATAHRQIGALPHAMSKLMLLMDRWPSLENRALSTFDADPALFQGLLRVHIGVDHLYKFAFKNGPRMLREMMRPGPNFSIPASEIS